MINIRSDAFLGDAYGHVTNQSGHARIGEAGALAGLVAWPMYGEGIATAVLVLYFLLVEVWGQGLVALWDSVEDAAHVGFGSLGVVALHYYGPTYALTVFVAWLVVLALGAGRRL